MLLTRTDGTLWAIGGNSAGHLGQNNTINYSSPVQVGSGTNWHTDNFAGGYFFSVAAKTDGTLWSWGYNGQGQLGQGTASGARISSPVQIPGQWSKVQSGGQGMFAQMIGSA